MNRSLLFLALFMLISCSACSKREKTEQADLIHKADSILKKDWIDSLLETQDTAKISFGTEEEKFIRLTKDSKLLRSKSPVNQSMAAKWGLDTSFVHDSYWLEFQTEDGRIKVLGSSGTDNSALWLVTLDKDLKAVDRYEIAGGECSGGWDDYEDKTCSCEFKMATQINDSTFVIRKLWECKKDWNAKSEFGTLDRWIVFINSQSKIIERTL